jgi:hypothetical protein
LLSITQATLARTAAPLIAAASLDLSLLEVDLLQTCASSLAVYGDWSMMIGVDALFRRVIGTDQSDCFLIASFGRQIARNYECPNPIAFRSSKCELAHIRGKQLL